MSSNYHDRGLSHDSHLLTSSSEIKRLSRARSRRANNTSNGERNTQNSTTGLTKATIPSASEIRRSARGRSVPPPAPRPSKAHPVNSRDNNSHQPTMDKKEVRTKLSQKVQDKTGSIRQAAIEQEKKSQEEKKAQGAKKSQEAQETPKSQETNSTQVKESSSDNSPQDKTPKDTQPGKHRAQEDSHSTPPAVKSTGNKKDSPEPDSPEPKEESVVSGVDSPQESTNGTEGDKSSSGSTIIPSPDKLAQRAHKQRGFKFWNWSRNEKDKKDEDTKSKDFKEDTPTSSNDEVADSSTSKDATDSSSQNVEPSSHIASFSSNGHIRSLKDSDIESSAEKRVSSRYAQVKEVSQEFQQPEDKSGKIVPSEQENRQRFIPSPAKTTGSHSSETMTAYSPEDMRTMQGEGSVIGVRPVKNIAIPKRKFSPFKAVMNTWALILVCGIVGLSGYGYTVHLDAQQQKVKDQAYDKGRNDATNQPTVESITKLNSDELGGMVLASSADSFPNDAEFSNYTLDSWTTPGGKETYGRVDVSLCYTGEGMDDKKKAVVNLVTNDANSQKPHWMVDAVSLRQDSCGSSSQEKKENSQSDNGGASPNSQGEVEG